MWIKKNHCSEMFFLRFYDIEIISTSCPDEGISSFSQLNLTQLIPKHYSGITPKNTCKPNN